MSISVNTEGRTLVLRVDMDAHPLVAKCWEARQRCVIAGWPKMAQTAHAVLARTIAHVLLAVAPYPKADEATPLTQTERRRQALRAFNDANATRAAQEQADDQSKE